MALLTGCLPLPHREPLIPRIEGSLISASGPLAGVRVVARNGSAKVVVLTKADGSFEIQEAVYIIPFTTVRIPDYELWLHAQIDGVSRELFWERSTGYAPRNAYRVQCMVKQSRATKCAIYAGSPRGEFHGQRIH
ncbi:hypothetical protein [Lysobacter humi (ex Lee et al. 2017)]